LTESLRQMGRKSQTATIVYVALLRGVNVGGNNMISMNALKLSFQRMGFAEVSTYINSGNILFRTKEADARKLERKIEAMLTKDHQLECKVVVRSFGEMEDLVKSLPPNWDADKEWKYNVIFLRHSIDSKEVLDRLGAKPDIERVVYYPGTLLWSGRVKDLNQTTMVKLSSQKIFQDMTVRNTNTTRKLHELMKKMLEG
jgi:uncharacterized protein (DUF1697 family)